MTQKTCETCNFFYHYSGTDRGRGSCRFNPPVVRTRDEYDPTYQVSGAFPEVVLNWWCGKWEKKVKR